MLNKFSRWGAAFLDAVLPAECVVCCRSLVDGERFICLHCDYELPRLTIDSFIENEIHYTLATTNPVAKAAGLFYYHRGSPFTKLIHQAKYNDRPQLARWLGEQLGYEYQSKGLFDEINAFVPVPINWFKEMRRGYNQSYIIAQGLSEVTGIPIIDCLKAKPHSTQTHKTARRRAQNAKGIYRAKKIYHHELSRYTHLMIVDDVITTGSTVLQCVEALREINRNLKVSVIAPAITKV